MNYSLNSSVLARLRGYASKFTWERVLVLLFIILICLEIGMFAISHFLYERINQNTPVYIVCDEKSRVEQYKELQEYIASTTLKSKIEKTQKKRKALKKVSKKGTPKI